MASIVIKREITNAGGTFTYDPQAWGGGNAIIFLYATGSVTLVADVNIVFSNPQNVGSLIQVIQFFGTSVIDLNGNDFKINGESFAQWVVNVPFIFAINNEDDGYITQHTILDLNYGELDGGKILDASLTLAKFPAQTRGSLILGNSSARPALLTIGTANYLLKSDGTDASWALISNTSIDAAAAIARTKIASGTNDHVLINSNTGVMSSEAQLAASRGGTGLNSAGSTGIARVIAGTWSFLAQLTTALGGLGMDASGSSGFLSFLTGTATIGALTDTEQLKVSFETNYVGDFKIRMGFPGTVVGIYAFLDKTIGAVDAVITPKNNAGTTLTNGVITFTASDPKGTAETSVPTANNTFAAGDILTFTTSGGSNAGVAQLSIDYTRTKLS